MQQPCLIVRNVFLIFRNVFLIFRYVFLVVRNVFLMTGALFLVVRNVFLMTGALFLVIRNTSLMTGALFLVVRNMSRIIRDVFLINRDSYRKAGDGCDIIIAARYADSLSGNPFKGRGCCIVPYTATCHAVSISQRPVFCIKKVARPLQGDKSLYIPMA